MGFILALPKLLVGYCMVIWFIVFIRYFSLVAVDKSYFNNNDFTKLFFSPLFMLSKNGRKELVRILKLN